jgi:succinylglutamate desuccinylase
MMMPRIDQLRQELSHLRDRLNSLRGSKLVAQDVWQIGAIPGAKVALTVSALIHGNETGGIGALNEFVNLLECGFKIPSQGLCIIIGNSTAALEGKRFLERDLNRSFGRSSDGTIETKRALEISPFLAKSRFYLDIHQTSMHSDRAFFIFPHTISAYQFARSILPRTTVVTHWGKPFSSVGMCTDEFVGKNEGTGITLELGQNGFDPFQISIGLHAIVNACSVVDKIMDQENVLYSSHLSSPKWMKGDLFTWQEVVPWAEAGDVVMDPGWTNFKPIEKGQKMGSHDGNPVLAPHSGWMMFPKYFSPEVPQLSRPLEMYRILKRITESDLPQESK